MQTLTEYGILLVPLVVFAALFLLKGRSPGSKERSCCDSAVGAKDPTKG